MNLHDITPVLLTWNEAPNIGRTLDALKWADQIIVMDSFSTDQTEAICRAHASLKFFQRRFTTHSEQWNAAIAHADTPWILSLDADYQVTPELRNEILSLTPDLETSGYSIPFRYAVNGIPLKRHILPPRIALFRSDRCTYIQDGHTQDLGEEGKVLILQNPIIHDDRKSFSRWYQSQIRYARLEAEKLFESPLSGLPLQDKLRKCMVLAPFVVFFYTLIYQRLLFEGITGWAYSGQRVIAECLLSFALAKRYLT